MRISLAKREESIYGLQSTKGCVGDGGLKPTLQEVC